jgi:hypothetical protein
MSEAALRGRFYRLQSASDWRSGNHSSWMMTTNYSAWALRPRRCNHPFVLLQLWWPRSAARRAAPRAFRAANRVVEVSQMPTGWVSR